MTCKCPTAVLEALVDKINQLLSAIDKPQQGFKTVIQAADYSGLSEKSIRRLISSGKLNGYRVVKGRVLVDKLELDRLILASNKQLRTGRGIRK